MRARRLVLTAAVGAALAVGVSTTSAAPARPQPRHVGTLQIAPAHVRWGATASSNWYGYAVGALARGTLFHAVSGTWTVPRVAQHTRGQAEASSTWVGIGGGCATSLCVTSDPTLIQAGTEQDVDAKGRPSYAAWYEIIPLPELLTPLAVHPGNRVRATIGQTLPGVWAVSLANLSTHQSWSTTVPYASTMDTAEWISETPLELGSARFASLPRLSKVSFRGLTVNGTNPRLSTADAMVLVDGNDKTLATPSAPVRTRNGFNTCAWASRCR